MLPLFSLSSVRSLFPPATCSSLYSFYSHSLSKRAQFFCSFRISPSEGHCWQILGCFLFENIFSCCHCEEVLSGLEFQVAPADPPVCHGKFAIVQGEVTAVRTIENCPLLASLLSISSHWLSHAIQPFTEPGSPESPRLGSFLHLDCQSPSPAPIPPRYPIFPGSALPLAPEVFAASDPSPLATAHRGLRAAFLHTDWVLFLTQHWSCPWCLLPRGLPPSLSPGVSAQGRLSTFLSPSLSDRPIRICSLVPAGFPPLVVGTHP